MHTWAGLLHSALFVLGLAVSSAFAQGAPATLDSGAVVRLTWREQPRRIGRLLTPLLLPVSWPPLQVRLSFGRGVQVHQRIGESGSSPWLTRRTRGAHRGRSWSRSARTRASSVCGSRQPGTLDRRARGWCNHVCRPERRRRRLDRTELRAMDTGTFSWRSGAPVSLLRTKAGNVSRSKR
jgi:hypothetical protein